MTSVSALQAESPGTRSAVEIARPFGFPITNSMVVTWIVAVGLIVFAQRATRTMKPVPDGAQNFVEKTTSALAPLLLGALLALGHSAADPLGVRLVGPLAALLVLVAFVSFRRYDLPDDVLHDPGLSAQAPPARA